MSIMTMQNILCLCGCIIQSRTLQVAPAHVHTLTNSLIYLAHAANSSTHPAPLPRGGIFSTCLSLAFLIVFLRHLLLFKIVSVCIIRKRY